MARPWLLALVTVAMVLTLMSVSWWGNEVKVATRPGDAQRGAQLYATLPCASCHDTTQPLPGGAVCPNLGNIATEAGRIVRAPDYHGRAKDAAGYLRESIVDPNAYVVPGESYHQADGQSVMPKDFAATLTPAQLDDLVAFLLTLR
jgi:nitric oxide reductase subunit C